MYPTNPTTLYNINKHIQAYNPIPHNYDPCNTPIPSY